MKSVLKKVGEALGKISDMVGKVPAKRVDMAIAVLVTLAAIGVYVYVTITVSNNAVLRFLDTIEVRSLDARFVWRGPRPVDDRIVIVGLDEKTLQNVGSFPIARNYYGKTVDQLAAGGARVIGFDFDFPTPEKNSAVDALKKLETEIGSSASPAVIDKIREIQRSSDNDALLSDSVKKAGNVVLGHIFLSGDLAKSMDDKAAEDYYNVLWGHPFPQMVKQPQGAAFDLNKAWFDPGSAHEGPVFQGIESNIRILAEGARSYGFFNYSPDRDGIYRRAMSVVRYRDREWFPSLPLEMLKVYENIKDQSTVAYINVNGMSSIELGPHTFATEPNGTFLVNFAGPFKTYPHYSMIDVINGAVPASTFQGKLVLLGPTALGIGDLRPMPVNR